MTTYQDIVDYLNKNKHYWAGFKLVKHDTYYAITEGEDSIYIYNDRYTCLFAVDKGLGQLLLDILNTPVDKRINSEIEHTVKPATAESVYTANLLTSADQVIQAINQAINTFLVGARCNYTSIMTIATNIGEDNLNKVLKLYNDYNIRVINKSANPDVFNLLIEPN